MAEAARWLGSKEAADYLSCQPEELRRYVRDGRIPAPCRHLGPRKPRWDRQALDAAMLGHLPSMMPTDADAAVEALRARLDQRPRRQNHSQASR